MLHDKIKALLDGIHSWISSQNFVKLGSDGKISSTILPSYVDDVIEGYFIDNKFYKESAHTTEIAAETGKIYVDISTNKTYRWSGSQYTQIKGDLVIGTTTGTAYDGGSGAALAVEVSGKYVKPSTGIPASDLASGVIPTTLPASDVYAWAKAESKPSYTADEVGALPSTTHIPSTTGELTNDAGFITAAEVDLANYYTKTEIDDAEFALSDAINDINLKIEDFDKMTENDVVDILNSLD